uniref:Complex 1 LYR protein domain-containing protein n=1 Tax=Pinguiococcus pyrenoidosus TaxID=172671 RepID=A0A7R9U0F6_9STRA
MAATRQRVLSGFRRLLRARKDLFRNDEQALVASQQELRLHFQHNRHETDPAKIQDMLRGIDEAEDMLRNHFVQGQLTEQGTYAAKIPTGHDGQELHSLTTDDLEKMAKEAECDVTIHKHSPNQ